MLSNEVLTETSPRCLRFDILQLGDFRSSIARGSAGPVWSHRALLDPQMQGKARKWHEGRMAGLHGGFDGEKDIGHGAQAVNVSELEFQKRV